MKFFIINTDYPDFLTWLYHEQPNLHGQSFAQQLNAHMESLFGVADFYSSNLRKLGHDVYETHYNNEHLQRAWARENQISVSSSWTWQFVLRKGWLPWLKRVWTDKWQYEILASQIKQYRPDVLFNQNIRLDSQFLHEMKPYIGLLVGQHASPIPQIDLSMYDLIISSLPNLVDYFRKQGLNSELHRLGFEPSILNRVHSSKRKYDVVFIGSIYYVHTERLTLLEYLCQNTDMKIWGNLIDTLPGSSPIHQAYQGKAWGKDMYQIFRDAKIVLNNHVDIAENYANNMRLFEATGTWTLRITDWKQNLHEMFELDKEVVTYHTPEECLEKIRYYLEHDEERQQIAHAGQQRTLTKHNYQERMIELIKIIT